MAHPTEQCKGWLTELEQMIYSLATFFYNSFQQNLSLKIIERNFLSKSVVGLFSWIATGHFIGRKGPKKENPENSEKHKLKWPHPESSEVR